MLNFLKKFFGSQPTVKSSAEAPYKVETPQTIPGVIPMSTPYAEASAPKKKPVAKRPASEKKPSVRAKAVRTKKPAAK